MNRSLIQRLEFLGQRSNQFSPVRREGRIKSVAGILVEAEGPNAAIGDICRLLPGNDSNPILAEVVGFRGNRILLMPYADISTIEPDAVVELDSNRDLVPADEHLLGRVINAIGEPIDGLGPTLARHFRPLRAAPPNPMSRPIISQPFATGVRSIDTFTPLGIGQRVGLFAGSGVGKSTLMGMIARNSSADVNVIGLIGERGRELREFIETELGPEGLERSVVVVSTSDQSAPLRLRAALAATSIAEAFRDQGKNVLFLVDSLTRFALAQREVGLAIGEPPATRGYTPSVFAMLPKLLERTGLSDRGSITAIYTVLVEGSDMDEPVADTVRGILDGHIVMDRNLANAGHYPPIDVLSSVSRLTSRVVSPENLQLTVKARELLAEYKRNEDMINVGAWVRGGNPHLDHAVQLNPALRSFLQQSPGEHPTPEEAFQQLQNLLK